MKLVNVKQQCPSFEFSYRDKSEYLINIVLILAIFTQIVQITFNLLTNLYFFGIIKYY